jgi:hypothetical protein
MDGATFDFSDTYEQIELLNRREKQLLAEIADIRAQRAALKSKCNISYLNGRPAWLNDLPEESWIPLHTVNKMFTSLNPNVNNRNVAPDLVDWHKSGGVFEFILNAATTVAFVYIGLQLIFLIL